MPSYVEHLKLFRTILFLSNFIMNIELYFLQYMNLSLFRKTKIKGFALMTMAIVVVMLFRLVLLPFGIAMDIIPIFLLANICTIINCICVKKIKTIISSK